MSETEFPETEVSDEPDTEEAEPVEERYVVTITMMSGHCQHPQTAHPQESHDRCARNGAGAKANPMRAWRPCRCGCHLGEHYECGNCGRTIAEATHWDGTGEMTYVHVHPVTGEAIGEDCP